MFHVLFYVPCSMCILGWLLLSKNQNHMNNSSEIIFCIKDLILKGILKFHSKEANWNLSYFGETMPIKT